MSVLDRSRHLTNTHQSVRRAHDSTCHEPISEASGLIPSVPLQRSVLVPAELGYGKKGVGEIPPGATFEMRVEVLSVG